MALKTNDTPRKRPEAGPSQQQAGETTPAGQQQGSMTAPAPRPGEDRNPTTTFTDWASI